LFLHNGEGRYWFNERGDCCGCGGVAMQRPYGYLTAIRTVWLPAFNMYIPFVRTPMSITCLCCKSSEYKVEPLFSKADAKTKECLDKTA